MKYTGVEVSLILLNCVLPKVRQTVRTLRSRSYLAVELIYAMQKSLSVYKKPAMHTAYWDAHPCSIAWQLLTLSSRLQLV